MTNFKVDGDAAISTSESDYAGREGMLKFLECAGLRTDRGRVSSAIPVDGMPASLADLFLLGGSVSQEGRFGNGTFLPRLVRSTSHINYLHTYSIASYDANYNWRESRDFAEKYFERDKIDNSIYVDPGWFADMIIFHEERSGALYMANPHIRTSDGEWEAWLFSHRFPGAYRFASVAELIGHLFLEKSKGVTDSIRFGRKEFDGTCAEMLFIHRR